MLATKAVHLQTKLCAADCISSSVPHPFPYHHHRRLFAVPICDSASGSLGSTCLPAWLSMDRISVSVRRHQEEKKQSLHWMVLQEIWTRARVDRPETYGTTSVLRLQSRSIYVVLQRKKDVIFPSSSSSSAISGSKSTEWALMFIFFGWCLQSSVDAGFIHKRPEPVGLGWSAATPWMIGLYD